MLEKESTTGSLPTVMLAFPDAGQVCTATTISMIETAMRNPSIRAVRHLTSPRVWDARNRLVREFLETDLDWLWFVDADMVFPSDTLERLLEVADPVARPVIGGLCFGQKKRELFSTIMRRSEDGVSYHTALSWPPNSLVDVDATGAACLLIHRTVLERLREVEPGPNSWFVDEVHAGKNVGHDIVFCERVKALGLPVMVHTGVHIGHLKNRLLDVDEFLRWMTRNRFLITGTGRCGTGFLARVLSLLGVGTHHEGVYRPDRIAANDLRWGLDRGEASWLAASFLMQFHGDVIHLVRHPLHVIGSFVGIGFFTRPPEDPAYGYTEWSYMGAGIAVPEPAVDEAEAIERAAQHYFRWNRMIEPYAPWQIRVEDIDASLIDTLTDYLGSPRDRERIERALERVGRDHNSRNKRPVSWDEIPSSVREELQELAASYGYSTTE